jgi:predicted nucleic acid-binding protein
MVGLDTNVLIRYLVRDDRRQYEKAMRLIYREADKGALAAQAGLAVTGTLGVLLRAKRSGDIPAIKPEIHALRSMARFFLSVALQTSVLSAAGE